MWPPKTDELSSLVSKQSFAIQLLRIHLYKINVVHGYFSSLSPKRGWNYCIMLFSEFLELLSNANDGNDHSERNESGKRDEASEEKSHSSGNLKDEKEHYTDEQDNAVRR